jgi:hypothetical protein
MFAVERRHWEVNAGVRPYKCRDEGKGVDVKRGLTVAIALIVMLSLAVPAGAKKQKPPPPKESVVTMTLVGGEGLATSCGSSIVMEGSQFDNRGLRAAEPMLETSIPIAWQRGYPTPGSSGGELTGCHGGNPIVVVPSGFETPEVFGGSLWLGAGPGGDTVSFKWLFDYYWEYTSRNNKRLTQHVLEMFDLSSEPMAFDWTSTEPQLVSGTFTLSWFQKIDGTIIEQFEPFGDIEIEFRLQIEPSG